MVRNALDALRSAKRNLSDWRWGEFGREMDRLERILEDMENTAPRE
jgi:hypothetical protein